MTSPLQLIAASKVREIAIEKLMQDLRAHERQWKASHPTALEATGLQEAQRWLDENSWRKYVPEALKELEEVAGLIKP